MKGLLALALCALFAVAGCGNDAVEAKPFNAQVWRAGNHEARGQMAQDLLAQRLLIGRTRDRVKEVLGNPDEETKEFITYFFNYGNYFGPPYLLHVEFGGIHGLVKDAWISD